MTNIDVSVSIFTTYHLSNITGRFVGTVDGLDSMVNDHVTAKSAYVLIYLDLIPLAQKIN